MVETPQTEEREKSTHQVEIVPVTLERHPNADNLSIVRVHDYTVVVRTADWEDVGRGAYLPPDSVVDLTRKEFSWLDKPRIKAKKLRGVWSMGLLIPAHHGILESYTLGSNVAEELGVTHYEPPMKGLAHQVTEGDAESPPEGRYPKYDVDALRRYPGLFTAGEEVWVTEKIHGANGRWVYTQDRMWCGSRSQWKKESESSLWWRALAAHPEVEQFCRQHPGVAVYGEVYGCVQDLRYGKKDGKVAIAVFDLLVDGQWKPPLAAVLMGEKLPWVPHLATMPFDTEKLYALAEGPSTIDGADHCREGIVVKPMVERTDIEIGRVQLKIVSNAYLERA